MKKYIEPLVCKFTKQEIDSLFDRIVKITKSDEEEKVLKRQEYNIKCLEVLKEIFDEYPFTRFEQMLFNLELGRDDNFYQEPDITLLKIKNKFEEWKHTNTQ